MNATTSESATNKIETIDFSQLLSANILRRIAALIYDVFLLAAISLLYGVILKILVSVNLISQGDGTDVYEPLTDALIMLGWWASLSYYFCYCWLKRGQTLAMKAWRIRLQQPDGSLVTRRQAWLRTLLAPLSLITVIGYLWCLFDPNRDCLHDKFTNTRVVTLPKKFN